MPLILLTTSAWRPLQLAPPITTKHYRTRKTPATAWLLQRFTTTWFFFWEVGTFDYLASTHATNWLESGGYLVTIDAAREPQSRH